MKKLVFFVATVFVIELAISCNHFTKGDAPEVDSVEADSACCPCDTLLCTDSIS